METASVQIVEHERLVDQPAEDLADGLVSAARELEERRRPILGQEQPNFDELIERLAEVDGRG
jgi:hypothetical protein